MPEQNRNKYRLDEEVKIMLRDGKHMIIPIGSVILATDANKNAMFIRLEMVNPPENVRQLSNRERVLPEGHDISVLVAEWQFLQKILLDDQTQVQDS